MGMHYLTRKHCVDYILERNSLPEIDSCPKLKYGVSCGGTLKEYQKYNCKETRMVIF